MARSLVRGCAAVAWALAAFVGRSPADAPPGNLAQSPSFEGPLVNVLPRGWNGLSTKEGSTYRHAIVGDARTGEQALSIEGRGGWAVVWNEQLPLDRGRRYRARGWVKVEGHADAAADVKFHYLGPTGYLGQSRIGFVNPRTPGWQSITVTDQAELFPTATHIQLAVALAGDGKAWFDDVAMTAAPHEQGGDGVNHVGNGDMEDVAADRPAGYFVFASGEVECRTSEERPASGLRCLFLRCGGEWATAGAAATPIPKDGELSVSGKIRVESGEAKLGIRYLEDAYQMVGNTDSDAVTGSDWQTVTLRTEFAAYPKATRFTVAPLIEGAGSAAFDDLRAVPVAK